MITFRGIVSHRVVWLLAGIVAGLLINSRPQREIPPEKASEAAAFYEATVNRIREGRPGYLAPSVDAEAWRITYRIYGAPTP